MKAVIPHVRVMVKEEFCANDVACAALAATKAVLLKYYSPPRSLSDAESAEFLQCRRFS